MLVRSLKGITADVLRIVAVSAERGLTKPQDPTDKHEGWLFVGADEKRTKKNSVDPSPLHACTVREVYDACGAKTISTGGT